jgi:hypothetical protein
MGDQAIDLCTAFEQLLGSGGDGSISWSNGLRCAALIGGDDAARKKHRDIIQCLYRIRNSWVHGGSVNKIVKSKTMGNVNVSEVMRLARLIYSKLLQVMVKTHDDIDWFDLETTGHGAPN